MEKMNTDSGDLLDDKEGLKAVGIEFSSEEGLVTWRKKYENGSVGQYTETFIGTDDQEKVRELKRQLEGEFVDGSK